MAEMSHTVGDVMEYGDRICRTCGKPHNYIVTALFEDGAIRGTDVKSASWADPDDGHVYYAESWEATAKRWKALAEDARNSWLVTADTAQLGNAMENIDKALAAASRVGGNETA